MSVTRVCDNVYSVGVQNPGLRRFDIVMESKYGTTYNAYLITGNKTVLVETVHSNFADEYIYNLQTLVDIASIDYIVMNHTEPDHSGTLERLLELNPSIEIVCTVAAKNNIKNILNRDFNCKVVKDGDKLDLGCCELEFMIAPLLHWPDSMFTYYKNENLMFTCDFLGAHFCEPQMFDTDIRYFDKYLGEFRYYFNGIFGPFKPNVRFGLTKLENLDLHFVCPSHGPILTSTIKDRMADYSKWAAEEEKKTKKAVIAYASAYGYTKMLAEAAKQTFEANGIDAVIMDIVEEPLNNVASEIASADALLVGSTTINRDAPKVVWDMLSSIDAINVKGKPALAFGSYGWTGEAVKMINARLKDLKYKVLGEGHRTIFKPSDNDIEEMKNYVSELINEMK